MKKIKFIQIQFLSYREKRGLTINLDYHVVIIKGANGSGKSSLIKSLYYSLGTEIEVWPQRWLDANIIYLLKFKIDDRVDRRQRQMCIRDRYNCDGSFRFRSKNSWEVSDKLTELLGIEFQMLDNENNVRVIPLGFLFAPFYIDQDRGWNSVWNSFYKIGIPNGKSTAQLYHAGIYTDSYNNAKNRLILIKKEIKECTRSIELIKTFIRQLKKQFDKGSINYDINKFNAEKKELVEKSEELKKLQKKHLNELSELYNQKISLEFQLQQLDNNISEIEKDYLFALQQRNILICPICQSKVENSEVGRYEMLLDIDQSKDLRLNLQSNLDDLNRKIDAVENKTQVVVEKIVAIQNLLAIKRENYSFEDVIESLVNQKLHDVIDMQRNKLMEEKNKKILLEHSLNESLSRLNNKEKQKNIEEKFSNSINKAYIALSIPNSNPKPNKITGVVKGVGSAAPRCIIAYNYSMLEIINENSRALFAPIVIDSPRQSSIDAETMKKMNNYIIKNKPVDSQLILGINKDDEFDATNCHLIEIESNIPLLKEEEYQGVKKNIEKLLSNSFFK